jgi:hypothetical protein
MLCRHNQGHLVREVINRIDGQRLKRFFSGEVAGPLNADFTIGSPPENHYRISNAAPLAALPVDPGLDESVAFKTIHGTQLEADIVNTLK